MIFFSAKNPKSYVFFFALRNGYMISFSKDKEKTKQKGSESGYSTRWAEEFLK